MEKPVLKTIDLVNEYMHWGAANRNKQDLRFGQYIHSKYDRVPDTGFYTEDRDAAYLEIYYLLQDYQR